MTKIQPLTPLHLNGTLRERVLAVMKDTGVEMRTDDILKCLGSKVQKPSVAATLSNLAGDKEVVRVEPGLYALPHTAPAAKKKAEPKKVVRAVTPATSTEDADLARRHKDYQKKAGVLNGSTQVRWKHEDEVIPLAVAMLNEMMQFPLGPNHESAVALYNLTISRPEVASVVRKRHIASVNALKSAGVIAEFGKQWNSLMEKLTAPETVLTEILEIEKVIEMTPQEALQKLSASDAIVALTQILVGRTAPLLGMIDRLEALAVKAREVSPAAPVEPEVVVETKRKPKVGVIFMFEAHKNHWRSLKDSVHSLELVNVLEDKKKVQIGRNSYSKVFVDTSTAAIATVRNLVVKACREFGIEVVMCDGWHELDRAVKDAAATEAR